MDVYGTYHFGQWDLQNHPPTLCDPCAFLSSLGKVTDADGINLCFFFFFDQEMEPASVRETICVCVCVKTYYYQC